MPIAVEVPYRHGVWIEADRVEVGVLERAVAIPQQDTHRARIIAGNHSEVEMAVAVEVPDHHGGGIEAGGVDVGVLERAVALAQQDGHGTVRTKAVGHSEVEKAINVK